MAPRTRVSLGKSGVSVRKVWGFQIHCAAPTMARARARVTTSLAASEVPSSRRMTPTSRMTPSTGAKTSRQMASDSSAFQPHPTCICQ